MKREQLIQNISDLITDYKRKVEANAESMKIDNDFYFNYCMRYNVNNAVVNELQSISVALMNVKYENEENYQEVFKALKLNITYREKSILSTMYMQPVPSSGVFGYANEYMKIEKAKEIYEALCEALELVPVMERGI